jgi:hypothetical protein
MHRCVSAPHMCTLYAAWGCTGQCCATIRADSSVWMQSGRDACLPGGMFGCMSCGRIGANCKDALDSAVPPLGLTHMWSVDAIWQGRMSIRWGFRVHELWVHRVLVHMGPLRNHFGLTCDLGPSWQGRMSVGWGVWVHETWVHELWLQGFGCIGCGTRRSLQGHTSAVPPPRDKLLITT